MNQLTGLPNYFEQQSVDLTHITSETINNSQHLATDGLSSNSASITSLAASSVVSTSTTSGSLTAGTVTGENIKYKNTGGVFDNLNVSYNTVNSLFYSFIPPANNWASLQPAPPTVLAVPNDDIKIGSRFVLKIGLEVQDLNPGSTNTIDWKLRMGNTGFTAVLFTTNPPHNQSTTIQIETEIVVVDKTATHYDFVVSSFYRDKSGSSTQSLVYSAQELNHTLFNVHPVNFEYSFKVHGTTGLFTVNRGIYSLYQIG